MTSRPRRQKSPEPNQLRVRMYQVGFGDAFLLSFDYPRALDDGRKERHMLMDFGTFQSPPGGSKMDEVADDIAHACGGKLDVIAVSHRHKDHLSGFSARARAKTIGDLKPKLVVRSWTEDPTAPSDATGPSSLGARSRGFAKALANGQTLSDRMASALTGLKEKRLNRTLTGVRGDLWRAANEQLKNAEAVSNLETWGRAEDADEEFLHFGMASKIEDAIPGARVRVIGPPTIEQYPDVSGSRAKDPEYWMLHQRLFRQALREGGIDTRANQELSLEGSKVDPGPLRWLVDRMRNQHVANLQRIVRELDDTLNNTSLILLIDAGDKRLLFPGDAQIENWAYALSESREDNKFDSNSIKELLAEVDFYKVGHHGSRNATPRTLFNLWDDEKNRERPMMSMMCTLSGVHGESEATKVPRATLREFLGRRSTLYTTDGLEPRDQLFIDASAKLTGGHPFEYSGPDDPSGGLFQPTLLK